MISPEHEQLVRDTWKRFEPVAVEHARFFYDKLYELDPEVRTLFASTNMDEQRHRLMETIGRLVTEIGDTDRFVMELVALGRRHATYGVRDSDYDAAGAALFWTIEQALGPEFTPDAQEAWNEAYRAMASVMRRVSTVVTGAHQTNSGNGLQA
ncbi:MAG TPA: globin domain-containing protein [Gemmatimonadaceae bacterium]|jgi:hemoglobin-like flavoprotein|nr:globin domain-containing protein [Gemmatimonadaceae bacterium]